jgi:hypothetical protein
MLTLLCSACCSDPELIYLTDGASKGVMQMLNAIIRNERDGVWLFLKEKKNISFPLMDVMPLLLKSKG